MSPARHLSVVAGVSLVYDFAIGLALLVATDSVAALFGVAVPEPRTFVTICGILLTCVGLGYLAPIRDPERHRQYLWLFGPLLKGAGAMVFLYEFFAGGAPASYLIFAAGDGGLALATLVALRRR